jgi:ubiquitin-like modifier-activating enzyme ATG7
MCRAKGYIKNVNTIEEFKNTDTNAMITDAGRQVRYVSLRWLLRL